ncbi:MAG: DUF3017 domain-containing protein [Propionibacterium sp.]|nr:DUF3017 domain-containing protein [Propionibacterium sp.]
MAEPHREPPMPDKPDKPAETMPSTLWPLLVVLLIMGGGIVYAVFEHWRRAPLMVGAAMFVAGMFRLILPREIAGLLVVRRKSFDVAVYLLLAVAIVVVALVVPPGR